MRTIAAVAAAALFGWFAREAAMRDLAPPAPVVSAASAPAAPESAPPPAARIAHYEAPLASHGSRNLFAYREAPAPRAASVVEETPAPIVESAPAPAPAIAPAPDPGPQFAYRFIGTFGTREKRLAAFTRDGEVLAVRAGGTIGTEFVLRAIGHESVDVQPLAGSGPARRVALGQ